MRWFGNVVLLCQCLGSVAVWPVMAQDVAGRADADTAAVTTDTMVQVQKVRTRWAIQPILGFASVVNDGEFGGVLPSSFDNKGPRLFAGGKIRAYPPVSWISFDLSAHYETASLREQQGRDKRMGEITLDMNMYLLDLVTTSNVPRKKGPYVTMGNGWIFQNNTDRSFYGIHMGAGLEYILNKRMAVTGGTYVMSWSEPATSESRGVPRSFAGGRQYRWYMAVGLNLFQN